MLRKPTTDPPLPIQPLATIALARGALLKLSVVAGCTAAVRMQHTDLLGWRRHARQPFLRCQPVFPLLFAGWLGRSYHNGGWDRSQ